MSVPPKTRQLELFGRTVEAAQWRLELLRRLEDEGEDKLADRLRKCGQPFTLYCKGCGNRHEVQTKCSRKWCPSCGPKRANERVARLRTAFPSLKWPLHITFTLENVELERADVNLLRRVMKSFRTLRRSKVWREKVKGGIVSVEVTNTGQGLHPHLHCLVDARWLALKTPEPHWSDDDDVVKTKFRCAAEELTAAWCKAAGQERHASVKIRRVQMKACEEVVKYAMKSDDLQKCEGRIGDVIRMLDAVRCVATFGSLFGLKFPDQKKSVLECECGDASWSPTPTAATTYDQLARADKLRRILAGTVKW